MINIDKATSGLNGVLLRIKHKGKIYEYHTKGYYCKIRNLIIIKQLSVAVIILAVFKLVIGYSYLKYCEYLDYKITFFTYFFYL